MILEPGTFRVSDHRKKIPAKVKREVRARYEEDHRPPLCERPFDTEVNDFQPPQHDPAHIFLVEKRKHDERTFGRKADASKTVTTRGSDIGEATRVRRLARSEHERRAKMQAKLAGAEPPARRPKRKLASRGFPKGRRPLRSRNNLRRRP